MVAKKRPKIVQKKRKWGVGGQAGAGAYNGMVRGLGATQTYSM
jgi:hypothetical protein